MSKRLQQTGKANEQCEKINAGKPLLAPFSRHNRQKGTQIKSESRAHQ